jgi:hypothetical protein
MKHRSVVMAVASYCSTADAERDLTAVVGPCGADDTSASAATLVEKGDAGHLTSVRYESTLADGGWPVVLLGAALTAVAAPLGIVFLTPLVVGRVAWSGVAVLVAHFWQSVPKDKLRKMGDLLEARQAALVIVALDHTEDEIAALLANATAATWVASTSDEFEADYLDAITADDG